jgi:acetyl-CoA C-acetyltransferase
MMQDNHQRGDERLAPIYILGGYQSDFSRHLAREGKQMSDLVAEITEATLHDARLEPEEIEAIHVANAFGELFTGQAHLAAMPATVQPRLISVPAARHEAACASGSLAILGAMAQIAAGWHDYVLVLGVEQERNVTGQRAAEIMGSAAWVGHEGQQYRYMWPAMFSELAEAYQQRYGLDYAHLGAIAEANIANAKRNPRAQTRNWQYEAASFGRDDDKNPVIEGWMRRQDCAQVSDGGAGLLLASECMARHWAKQHGRTLESIPRIVGVGHRSDGLPLGPKLDHDRPIMLWQVQGAINSAFRMAGLRDVWQLDCIETHDCFSITQYMAIDHFGITAPGQSWRAIESGEVAFGGRLPINPSGGLIGGGHPVGATGIRMLWDAAQQVSNRAGDYQVEGAKRAATLNLGGSAATIVSFVVETTG